MAQILREHWQALSQLPTTRQHTYYAAIATSLVLCGAAVIRWNTSNTPSRKPSPTSLNQTHAKQPCRFDLTTATSAKLLLPDGRYLGYAEYGSPTGTPVIFLHGAPGSRLEAAHLNRPARELGIRIIAPDRPGMGWSSPKPHRTLLDHADDVRQLTTYLGLDEYSVLVRSLTAVVCGQC